MATQRQIEANRRNAAGPHQMSEKGKDAVRINAIRHGLTTQRHIILATEDEVFYNEILHGLQDEYDPATTQEEMLVHQIAEHHWRLLRARTMETGCFDLSMHTFQADYGEAADKHGTLAAGTVLASGMVRLEHQFNKINRYEASAERSYYRAIRELTRIQKARKQEPATEQADQSDPEPVATGQIRSVSQIPKPIAQEICS